MAKSIAPAVSHTGSVGLDDAVFARGCFDNISNGTDTLNIAKATKGLSSAYLVVSLSTGGNDANPGESLTFATIKGMYDYLDANYAVIGLLVINVGAGTFILVDESPIKKAKILEQHFIGAGYLSSEICFSDTLRVWNFLQDVDIQNLTVRRISMNTHYSTLNAAGCRLRLKGTVRIIAEGSTQTAGMSAVYIIDGGIGLLTGKLIISGGAFDIALYAYQARMIVGGTLEFPDEIPISLGGYASADIFMTANTTINRGAAYQTGSVYANRGSRIIDYNGGAQFTSKLIGPSGRLYKDTNGSFISGVA